MKTKSLSDKIREYNKKEIQKIHYLRFIFEKDIKEAVRLLKEEFVIGKFTSSFIKKKIDRIFGDKLNGWI